MRASTYFRAYERTRNNMEIMRDARPSRCGIAVDLDWQAVKWRRYKRLASKLRKRLVAIHAEYDAR